MSKLYLVRRGLETLLGPMSSSELRSAYKRMDFGLQDEVCGHCGRWVQFEDIEKIKRFYPELTPLVKETMLGGWGISENSGKDLTRSRRPNRGRKPRRSLHFGMAVLVVVTVTAVVGIFLARTNNLPSKFLDNNDPDVLKAAEILTKSGKGALVQYLSDYQETIVEDVKRSKKSYQRWLPYLRVAAFSQDGEITGLKPAWLRGVGKVAAPADCSVKRWKRRFSEIGNEWSSFSNGREMPQRYWSRLLLWDPHWIKRRSDSGDWLDPSSYYEACLLMADKAVETMASFPEKGTDPNGLNQAKARIEAMLAVIQGRSPEVENSLDSLGILTCMENATSVAAVDECKPDPEASPEWQNYFAARSALNKLRIVVGGDNLAAQDINNQLLGQNDAIPAVDPQTTFDYRAEQKLLKLILLNRGNVAEALKRFDGEFRNVNFGAD